MTSAHSTDMTAKTTQAASTSPRRPRASLTGPDSNWPSAIPAMHEVIVSCATEAEVCNDDCISGSDAM